MPLPSPSASERSLSVGGERVNIDEINIETTPKRTSGAPDPSWLTTAQAAARLGVKPATLYAYVSRGLIPRRRGPDGRASYFASADVERLARRTPHSRLAPTDIVIPTAVSFIDPGSGTLWYRGVDAVEATTAHRFEDIAEFLWTGKWNGRTRWEADTRCVRAAMGAQRALPRSTPPIDRIPVIVAVARAADAGRDDLSPDGVVRTGRNLIATVVETLPAQGDGEVAGSLGLAGRLWSRLSRSAPSRDEVGVLDATLGSAAEYGVTLSVVAARLAASLGADPYAAVSAALGPHVASTEGSRLRALEALLLECERTSDVDEAVETLVEDREGTTAASVDLYPAGDPRVGPILEGIRKLGHRRAEVVDAAIGALRRRGHTEPDLAFAVSALAFVFGFAPGSASAIMTVAGIAGWIAHAAGEYRRPTPFRPHATYIGTPPTPEDRADRRLLHAVMNYLREE